MKKISRQAADAFILGMPSASGNTTVIYEGETSTAPGVTKLILFGNVIAYHYDDAPYFLTTCAGFASATTHERLNSLLRIYSEKISMNLGGYHRYQGKNRFNGLPVPDDAVLHHHLGTGVTRLDNRPIEDLLEEAERAKLNARKKKAPQVHYPSFSQGINILLGD